MCAFIVAESSRRRSRGYARAANILRGTEPRRARRCAREQCHARPAGGCSGTGVLLRRGRNRPHAYLGPAATPGRPRRWSRGPRHDPAVETQAQQSALPWTRCSNVSSRRSRVATRGVVQTMRRTRRSSPPQQHRAYPMCGAYHPAGLHALHVVGSTTKHGACPTSGGKDRSRCPSVRWARSRCACSSRRGLRRLAARKTRSPSRR